jgi:hypothetical protein
MKDSIDFVQLRRITRQSRIADKSVNDPLRRFPCAHPHPKCDQAQCCQHGNCHEDERLTHRTLHQPRSLYASMTLTYPVAVADPSLLTVTG